jgi:hypothetical protein
MSWSLAFRQQRRSVRLLASLRDYVLLSHQGTEFQASGAGLPPAQPIQATWQRLLQPLFSLALALGLGGCAGYKLGPVNGLAAGEKSIQISPFANQTLQPRLTDVVTSQLRKEIQRDGTYRLATHGDADIVVSGALTRYLREEVTLAQNDILTVRDFRVSLTARVTARERSTGKVILDQPVTGYTLIRVGADLPSAERQGMPLLAEDLSKNVTALLVEGKW